MTAFDFVSANPWWTLVYLVMIVGGLVAAAQNRGGK